MSNETDILRELIEYDLAPVGDGEPDFFEVVFVSYDEQAVETVGFFESAAQAKTHITYQAMTLDAGRHNPDTVVFYHVLDTGGALVYSMTYTQEGAYAIVPQWYGGLE